MAALAVDPRNANLVSKLLNGKTRAKYLKSWFEFVDFSGISTENPPTERHFLEYFEKKRQVDTFAGSSLWTEYSGLNHVYNAMYKKKLQASFKVCDY